MKSFVSIAIVSSLLFARCNTLPLDNLTSELETLHAKIDAVLEQNKAILKENSELKSQINRLHSRQIDSSTVAFTAQLSHDVPQLASSQAIDYDKGVTNIGNAYNSQHGQFTAPIAGVYHFSTTIMAAGDDNVHIQVVKNGNEIARAYTSRNDYESAVAIVITKLAAGDRVWVRHFYDSFTPHVHGLGYTTFSGFLITSEVS